MKTLGTILVAVLMTSVASLATSQQWEVVDVPIHYNPTASPYPTEGVEDAIEYGMWIAGKRTGVVSHYQGTSSLTTPSPNSTLVTWQPPSSGVVGSTVYWNYVDNGLRSRAQVKLNPSSVSPSCLWYVVAHEMGHALSMTEHTDQEGELMWWTSPASCRGALGQMSAALSPYTGGDKCFVELLPNGDLFIPDHDGNSAYLQQTSEFEWALLHYYEGGDGTCSTVEVDGGDIIMTDVQGWPGTSFSRVELENIGPDLWALRYAE